MGGLISAAGSLGAGLLSSKGQSDANKQNVALAKYQNQWNLDQWNRENEYNTPSSQLQRLKDAGLNPNLVYGSGTAVTQAASSPRAADAKVQNEMSGTSGGMSQALQMVMSTVMQQAQLNKMNAQSELARSQRDLAVVNQDLSRSNISKNVSQSGYYDTSSSLNVKRESLIDSQISSLDAQTLYTNARTSGQATFNEYAAALNQSKLDLQASVRDLNIRQTQAISEKVAQAWKQLDISEGNYQVNSSNSFWRNHMIEQSIENLKSGQTATDIKNEMLKQNLDYKHVNAFFDALTKATRWIPGF